jgi:hypothetical protein
MVRIIISALLIIIMLISILSLSACTPNDNESDTPDNYIGDGLPGDSDNTDSGGNGESDLGGTTELPRDEFD